MNMSTAHRDAQPTAAESLTAQAGHGSLVDNTSDATTLPVPRVDEDDYAPTIIRGRE